jgi:hypothetical protein
MKNIKILLSIAILLTIVLTANSVMAAGNVTWATGASTQTGSVGDVKTSTLGFNSSSQSIGIVSGTISFNSEYITDVNVEQADWMLTYNPNNGKFNGVKSTGAASANLMKITYKIIKESTSPVDIITLSDVKYTSTSYETFNENRSAVVKLSASSPADTTDTSSTANPTDTTTPVDTEDTTETTNPTDTTQQPVDTTDTSTNTNVPSTNTNNNTGRNNVVNNGINNNNNSNKNNTSNGKNDGKDTTMANKGLPYTGKILGNSIKFIIAIAIISILVVRYFVKYKKIDVE